jgi:hypothetical protein
MERKARARGFRVSPYTISLDLLKNNLKAFIPSTFYCKYSLTKRHVVVLGCPGTWNLALHPPEGCVAWPMVSDQARPGVKVRGHQDLDQGRHKRKHSPRLTWGLALDLATSAAACPSSLWEGHNIPFTTLDPELRIVVGTKTLEVPSPIAVHLLTPNIFWAKPCLHLPSPFLGYLLFFLPESLPFLQSRMRKRPK